MKLPNLNQIATVEMETDRQWLTCAYMKWSQTTAAMWIYSESIHR